MATSKRSKGKHVSRIFTDGACSGNPGVGGWASIVLLNDKVHKLSGCSYKTTNNRMEIMAVIQGLLFAHHRELSHIQIYSDSAYVINAITKGWIHTWRMSNWKKSDNTEVKNSDLWKKLYKLITSNDFESIEFYKVKGHSGNHFNEMADALAKEEVQKVRQLLNGTCN